MGVARGVCGLTGLIKRCVITRQLCDKWKLAETVRIENFVYIGDRHNQGKMRFLLLLTSMNIPQHL